MRRFFPFLLLFGLLAACASPEAEVASDSEQSGPVVTVFYSPS